MILAPMAHGDECELPAKRGIMGDEKSFRDGANLWFSISLKTFLN